MSKFAASESELLILSQEDCDIDPDPIFVDRLTQAFPNVSRETVRDVSTIWTDELCQIIRRMMAISDQELGSSLHVEARPVAIFEMAKLRVWLANQIVKKKLAAPPTRLNVTAEKESVVSKTGQARIEDTARICADQIWMRLMLKWRKRWPLIVDYRGADSPRTNNRLVDPVQRAPGVRRNHYSPISANKPWGLGRNRDLREYTRNVDGSIRSRDISPKQWGYEDFLYSRRLEDYLKLVDDDGARTRRKLLRIQPLNDLDKRRWIAFLLIQWMRTPSFLQFMMTRMRRIAPIIAPTYPTTTVAIRTTYETLFTNNDVYAGGHQLLAARDWAILRAPSDTDFIRADNPVLLTGSTKAGDWTLSYPMSPTSVFQVGPSLERGYDRVFVPSIAISNERVSQLNMMFAANARRSVIAIPKADDSQLRELLTTRLGERGLLEATEHDQDEPWGSCG